jgi:prepilin peptidase CpaA
VPGLVLAALVDARTRRIPNAVTVPMSALGLSFGALGTGDATLGASAAGFVLGLLLMLPGHALGATGAGDVKLMAAVGALVGPADVVYAFLWTALAGGMLAVVVALSRGRLSATLAGTGRLLMAPAGAKETIGATAATSRFAYGPAIAIGSLVAALT